MNPSRTCSTFARNADDLEQSREYLALADTELRRASAITSQTLRFHRQSTKPSEVTCEDLIFPALNILSSRILNANITVEPRKRTNRPVLCFDGEIRQVISNLLINAVDCHAPRWRAAHRAQAAKGTMLPPNAPASS